MDDDELIQRAKQGDPDAWRELYRAHAGRLVVWLEARPSGDTASTAEDLAAEAWLTAAQKIVDFRGDSSDFAGWLFGIARNLHANSRRRSLRRRTDPTAHEDLQDTQVTEGHEGYLAGQDWVKQALGSLSARERDVVGCIDVVGLDVESTAQALGISAVAVRVAHHRGLRKLRRAGSGGQPPVSAASSGSR
ncbi:RNA polymerase sigma factor [Nocardioides ferulae]|uniref:RNA polymerase sigma factor n=1 Tax=Nocardioides ferulae TaxID=2340821 RepID=UPI000EB4F233|nr:RNA polymerase sigma factor [Nocardioides ferulae]